MRYQVPSILVVLCAWAITLAASINFYDQASLHASYSPSFGGKLQSFRVITNENVQGYAVRVKQPLSCEQGVQYSGYIDNLETDDHFFFWFFESRNAPKTDPLVLWLNGGPGCSSMMGLWMELGPCLVNTYGNETRTNKYSWNNVANVVFLDQPVNVGYSYGKSKTRSSKESARDVYAFLQLFLTEFPEYADNPLHIAGESYGGHYLPALAAEIVNRNKEGGHLRLAFESMLIGNGWTEPRTQFKHYETYSCAQDSIYKPIFNETECQKMRDTYPRCKAMMDICYRIPTAITCVPANMYCERTQASNFDATGLNPYDIRKKCAGDSGLCYNELDAIETYANRPEVRWELGVDDEAGQYRGCDNSVGARFGFTGDGARDFSHEVAQVLEEGIRVLLYVGDMDWICNWYGNKAWSLDMEWSGQEGYGQSLDEPWYNQDTFKQAGEVRSYGGLTFLRVFDAGHMVPYDQPENALDFFARWLNNKPLNN